ncbi:tRNA (adenosine(37)-N6)-threonylcarbamoyltransferase complex dimerization subunit type 1 TsaB [[Mycoplasma] falconis]|uniref:tRNA (Adenosine(37)-N6)-threonylcarbamoyltransferase complex dimerization subunit type 1 TsaB n=1 Tax=[Mycoplasma] falconis TaxID=92403 RepID=A0A501XAL7_9BACT|nr:tRNA (adenosine(37)-N6)-threonylcarbamoyltransferase complex dimerization subunit type 1 TsaB [[Mycoplasma] falconis]TPE57582.1 tRNA (adenosine(37)-N6)-threonylcarbamoyltransferase complex dimerization subunit type 1 TsaB [[Mycoplasma] falconis]
MNLFIETSLSDLYFCLFKKNKVIASINKPNLVKKTDAFYETLNELFKKANVSLKDIENIYTTLGPGSFSGARIGLLFAKTIAQISDKQMYTTATYNLFKVQNYLQNKDVNNVYIKANKYSVYHISFLPNLASEIINNDNNFEIFDYSLFENNLSLYFQEFKQEKDLETVELLYLHEPQIGGNKC